MVNLKVASLYDASGPFTELHGINHLDTSDVRVFSVWPSRSCEGTLLTIATNFVVASKATEIDYAYRSLKLVAV